jgi:hypothetical protein
MRQPALLRRISRSSRRKEGGNDQANRLVAVLTLEAMPLDGYAQAPMDATLNRI